jgi:hypothetical protein
VRTSTIVCLCLLALASCSRKGEPAREKGPEEEHVGKLKSDDPRVRLHAAAQLGALGEQAKGAVPALTEALKDSDENVREVARDALARIEPEGALARSGRVKNSLKQLGVAMHAYHDNMGRLPPPTVAVDTGKSVNGGPTLKQPGLSWRVQLLPYLDEVELYKQFNFNLPWDAEPNKSLIAKMPKVYAPPAGSPAGTKPGETHYQVFVGLMNQSAYNGAVFPHPFEVLYLNRMPGPIYHITDGTSNTFLVAESEKPVIWTKPDDLVVGAGPLPPLGHSVEGVFHVLFADGSVRVCGRRTPARELRRFIAPSDGFSVDHHVLDPDKAPKAPSATAMVTGEVLLKAQPLSRVWVVLSAEDGSEHAARADAEGRFAIKNVPVGRAKVMVLPGDPYAGWLDGPEKMPKRKAPPLPPEYQSEETTPLTVDVQPGGKPVSIQLK